MTAGFRKGEERSIYKGRIIDVAVGAFFAPDGERLERELVHHRGAVSVVPIIGDEVVLVRQYRPALDLELLEIPAGLRDVDGEAPEETAARELAEEIAMHPGKLEHLCSFFNAAGFSDEKIEIYLATDLTPAPQQTQSAEEAHMTVERVRLADVDALIASGELCDAKSIIGLLLAPATARAASPAAGVTEDVEAFPLEVEDFLTHLAVEKGRSANTLAAYRRDLRRYLAYLAARGDAVGDATQADVIGYVQQLRRDGFAPASVARMAVAVRGMHRYLLAEDLLERDPAADVEAPGVPRGLPKALTEEQVTRLIDAVVADTPVARRDRAILEVLYGCGIRISELCGLSMGDIDLDGSTMRVFGKGAKERVVPLGRMAAVALGAWLSAPGRGALEPERWRRRDDSDAVFLNARGGRLTRQGAWGVVHKYGEMVGLTEVLTPHVLRHSCATHMLDHGADIRTVQELLGHASIATTQIYTKVSTDRLVQVYLDAHPRARGKAS